MKALLKPEKKIVVKVNNTAVSGVVSKDYLELENKPSINSIELVGNLSSSDLGLLDSTSLIGYRTASEQDAIDSTHISKTDFTDSVTNPNGLVMLWMEIDHQSDFINIDYAGYKPVTGEFNNGSVNIPFADETQAGIMSKEDKIAMASFITRIANLESGAVGSVYVDTYADLLAIDTTSGWVLNQQVIVRADENHNGSSTAYHYIPDSTDPSKTGNGFIFGIVLQEVPYSVATTDELGMILSSVVDGGVYVEATGRASVIGWDVVKSDISTMKSDIAALQSDLTGVVQVVTEIENIVYGA